MQRKQCYRVQVEALRQKIASWEGAAPSAKSPPVSSGCPALDHALPQQGFRRGALVEWLAADEGCGAVTLALMAARHACLQDGTLVVLDCMGEFYPPAAARLGIDLTRMIVVQPATQADHHWALDQALRCPAVAAVLAWPDARGGMLDSRTFRRLQLAAEEGGSLGLLVRSAAARAYPSWADVRLFVEPLPAGGTHWQKRRLRIVLLRCRGGSDGRNLELEVDG